KLKENDVIKLDELSSELFKENEDLRNGFVTDLKMKAIDNEVFIDPKYIEKKLKRIRLNIDKQIDLYINEGAYHDSSKFAVQRNGDGSINLVIKNVINYIEK
ncbi:nucleoid-associated protein, partial [Clostridium botulinum]|nr:nucleoid-associated protein [Clostridium botulinum]